MKRTILNKPGAQSVISGKVSSSGLVRRAMSVLYQVASQRLETHCAELIDSVHLTTIIICKGARRWSVLVRIASPRLEHTHLVPESFYWPFFQFRSMVQLLPVYMTLDPYCYKYIPYFGRSKVPLIQPPVRPAPGDRSSFTAWQVPGLVRKVRVCGRRCSPL
ncbi:hypothetical protein OE88DRAFT_894466 [Heliocybe sulcata]|uniref:Uncharacterized protein n=1 Tax=Heliocybe sulcata TaxID=5364 RepID=A0A5C3MYD3_9AGAM|nr:hypothetical protein OE88DRAFT_894466 [Heliocybe sulcata]